MTAFQADSALWMIFDINLVCKAYGAKLSFSLIAPIILRLFYILFLNQYCCILFLCKLLFFLSCFKLDNIFEKSYSLWHFIVVQIDCFPAKLSCSSCCMRLFAFLTNQIFLIHFITIDYHQLLLLLYWLLIYVLLNF